jgi:prepilin-type N-terminal cleavage/methylation domain-containing protein
MAALLPQTSERGFSLIELLIVVLIIGTLAAIALPNYLESRQSAHNASALGSLRLIGSAEAAYRASHDQYTNDLNALHAQGYLNDPLLASGNRSNYTFTIPAGTVSDNFYEVSAAPNIAPWRYYYMDVSGVIRFRTGGTADGNSPPINY